MKFGVNTKITEVVLDKEKFYQFYRRACRNKPLKYRPLQGNKFLADGDCAERTEEAKGADLMDEEIIKFRRFRNAFTC